MEDPPINDDALEQIIPEAINGDHEALNLLMAHRWMRNLLDILTRWASRKFDTERYPEAGSVPAVIYEKLLREGHTITNGNNRRWSACLKSWCFTVIGNYYRNEVRHWKVELKHMEQPGESQTDEPCSPAMTPEEELLAKEEELLEEREKRIWEERGAELRARLRNVMHSFPPKDVSIISLWAKGQNLREIAGATKIPLSTVGRREKKMLKALVEEVEAFMKEKETENHLEDDEPALEVGLQAMVAHVLQEMAGGADAARVGA